VKIPFVVSPLRGRRVRGCLRRARALYYNRLCHARGFFQQGLELGTLLLKNLGTPFVMLERIYPGQFHCTLQAMQTGKFQEINCKEQGGDEALPVELLVPGSKTGQASKTGRAKGHGRTIFLIHFWGEIGSLLEEHKFLCPVNF
jgi:hypothetical protein